MRIRKGVAQKQYVLRPFFSERKASPYCSSRFIKYQLGILREGGRWTSGWDRETRGCKECGDRREGEKQDFQENGEIFHPVGFHNIAVLQGNRTMRWSY